MALLTVASRHCPLCGAMVSPRSIACRSCGAMQVPMRADLQLPFWRRSYGHAAAVVLLGMALALSTWLVLVSRQPVNVRALWFLANIFGAGMLATCLTVQRRLVFFVTGLLVEVAVFRIVVLLLSLHRA